MNSIAYILSIESEEGNSSREENTTQGPLEKQQVVATDITISDKIVDHNHGVVIVGDITNTIVTTNNTPNVTVTTDATMVVNPVIITRNETYLHTPYLEILTQVKVTSQNGLNFLKELKKLCSASFITRNSICSDSFIEN